MKKIIIFLFLLCIIYFNFCSPSTPIPRDYPQLTYGINTTIEYEIISKSKTTKRKAMHTSGFRKSYYSFREIAYFVSGWENTNPEDLQTELFINGKTVGEYNKENCEMTIERDKKGILYGTHIEKCEPLVNFNVTISGNDGGYIWGEFSGQLARDTDDGYCTIVDVQGKFSAAEE